MSIVNRSIIVSIIGRPNVGKSSLFNRLMQKQTKAITFNEPGVTRDRNYGITEIGDQYNVDPQEIVLVDTGGFYPEEIDESQEERKNAFFNRMREHAKMAIDESDLVLFMVDIREGLLPYDREICNYLRKSKKKYWLVINKYDSDAQVGDEVDFYELGIDPQDIFLTSSSHGLGIADLRERIQSYSYLQKSKGLEESKLQSGLAPKHEVITRLAIIGAPNAGKSTLLNSLLGESRALVSDIPGTTMDPIEGYFEIHLGKFIKEIEEFKGRTRANEDFVEQYNKFRQNHPDLANMMEDSFESDADFMGEIEGPELSNFEESEEEKTISNLRSIHIVDTAGIRKKANIDDIIESQSVYRALRSITDAQIVLYMIDMGKGITHQDKRLIEVAVEKGKSIIILLNKYDLHREKYPTQKEWREFMLDTRDDIPWLEYVDIIPISAKDNFGINKLLKTLKQTIYTRCVFIPTSEVNKAIFQLVNHHSVLIKGGRAKKFKVKYASQVKSAPPTFLLYANRARSIPENYKKFLKNGIRKIFGIKNTPVHIVVRTSQDLANKVKKEKSSTLFRN